jgi:hypothetical protein
MNLLLLLLLNLSGFLWAAPHDPDTLMAPDLDFRLGAASSETDVTLYVVRRQLLRESGLDRLPGVVDLLLQAAPVGRPNRRDNLVIFDGILRYFKHFISTDEAWFRDLLFRLILAEDVEAVRIVLRQFHDAEFLFQCLDMNLHNNEEITAVFEHWLNGGEGEQEPAAAAVPAGPRLQVFRLGDGGVFGEEAGDVHVDPVSGYFHVRNANRIVMGMVLPALNPAILNANLLDGSLDDFMLRFQFGPVCKGMVLWYDRPANRATLRRIKNTHDATAPALGIFRHSADEDVAFSQLDASMDVVVSTLRGDRNAATATIPMAPGYIVMAFPQAATDELEPFELNTVLDEFGTNVAEAEIAGNMRDGLLGARPIVREGALYAAYLH